MAIELVKGVDAHLPYVAPFQDMKSPAKGDRPEATSGAAPGPQDGVSLTKGKDLSSLGQITGHVEGNNALAKTLNGTVTALQSVAVTMDSAKQELYKIVKNFPPFGVDSADRRSILRSYASLRKEIDALTVPAPPKPFYDQHRVELGQYFDSTGKVDMNGMPSLALDAPDQQVQTAASALDTKVASFHNSSKVLSDLFISR